MELTAEKNLERKVSSGVEPALRRVVSVQLSISSFPPLQMWVCTWCAALGISILTPGGSQKPFFLLFFQTFEMTMEGEEQVLREWGVVLGWGTDGRDFNSIGNDELTN